MSLFNSLFFSIFLLFGIHTFSMGSAVSQERLPRDLKIFVKDACRRVSQLKKIEICIYDYRLFHDAGNTLCVAIKIERSGWCCISYRNNIFQSMYCGIDDAELARYLPVRLVWAKEVRPVEACVADPDAYLFR